MLIGIDSNPCSLSLRNRSTFCSTTKCHQNKWDLKNVFVQKSFFFQYLLFFQSQSCLLESTAAIFRQSAGYVLQFKEFRLYWCIDSKRSSSDLLQSEVFVLLIAVSAIPGGYYCATNFFKSPDRFLFCLALTSWN